MNRQWHIVNWNIRGINDSDKWNALRNKINEARGDIICIQETKREQFDSKYISNFCPKLINKFDYVPSIGASGGILTAWNGSLFIGETIQE